ILIGGNEDRNPPIAATERVAVKIAVACIVIEFGQCDAVLEGERTERFGFGLAQVNTPTRYWVVHRLADSPNKRAAKRVERRARQRIVGGKPLTEGVD